MKRGMLDQLIYTVHKHRCKYKMIFLLLMYIDHTHVNDGCKNQVKAVHDHIVKEEDREHGAQNNVQLCEDRHLADKLLELLTRFEFHVHKQ